MAQKKNDENTVNSGMDIPDYAIERIARCMLPMIQNYYESEAGKKELAEWQAINNKEATGDR